MYSDTWECSTWVVEVLLRQFSHVCGLVVRIFVCFVMSDLRSVHFFIYSFWHSFLYLSLWVFLLSVSVFYLENNKVLVYYLAVWSPHDCVSQNTHSHPHWTAFNHKWDGISCWSIFTDILIEIKQIFWNLRHRNGLKAAHGQKCQGVSNLYASDFFYFWKIE